MILQNLSFSNVIIDHVDSVSYSRRKKIFEPAMSDKSIYDYIILLSFFLVFHSSLKRNPRKVPSESSFLLKKIPSVNPNHFHFISQGSIVESVLGRSFGQDFVDLNKPVNIL